ncbi:hypothetical protein BDV09DRAFT_184994 [Aspergillus tetrazonus]
MPTVQETPFDLPGLTLPLDFKPTRDAVAPFFANALDYDDIDHIFTVRELYMMRIMEAVTDKPNWDTKVWNKEITDKWRSEILQGDLDVAEAMIDYIFRELEWKAPMVKSDTAIPQGLKRNFERLRITILAQMGRLSTWSTHHSFPSFLAEPGSFATRLIRNTEPSRMNTSRRRLRRINKYSERFQWLPCNVESGPNGECQIASYINNLHPIITRTIPLWNVSLASRGDLPRRIPYRRVSYPSDEESEPEYDSSDDFDERYEEWRGNRRPKQPEPCPFQAPQSNMHKQVDLREQYRDKGLQVIVKLANIELTPEKPDYEGGAWNIEGQLNERICATAIYYYDSENITESTLSFRHRADTNYFQEVRYEQDDFQFLRIFGFEPRAGRNDYEQITRDLGWVSCRMGRLLTFPNTLQHRVSPPPKILALFLIDPSRRIISTANVPPQREHWCNDWAAATNDVLNNRLPRELQAMVRENLEFPPMTMDEAKAHRVELMAERSSKSESENEMFTRGDFSLCEH